MVRSLGHDTVSLSRAVTERCLQTLRVTVGFLMSYEMSVTLFYQNVRVKIARSVTKQIKAKLEHELRQAFLLSTTVATEIYTNLALHDKLRNTTLPKVQISSGDQDASW